MEALGVLGAVLPEGAAAGGLARLLAIGAPGDPILRLAALLTGDAAAVAMRLKLSGVDRERLIALCQPATVAPADDDAALRRALADELPDILTGRAWLAGEPGLAARLGAIPRPVFALVGRDVVRLGVPAGPRVGSLLRDVRLWWKARGCVDSADACRAELRRLIGV